MKETRIASLNGDVTSKTTKQRRGCFEMCGRFLIHIAVLDDDVPISEDSERFVPRRKLGDVAQGSPGRLAHCAVVTAAPGRRQQVHSWPLPQVRRQPLG